VFVSLGSLWSLQASERKLAPPRSRPSTPRELLMESIKQGRRLKPSLSPLRKKCKYPNYVRIFIEAGVGKSSVFAVASSRSRVQRRRWWLNRNALGWFAHPWCTVFVNLCKWKYFKCGYSGLAQTKELANGCVQSSFLKHFQLSHDMTKLFKSFDSCFVYLCYFGEID
jgi:hypothetical protein